MKINKKSVITIIIGLLIICSPIFGLSTANIFNGPIIDKLNLEDSQQIEIHGNSELRSQAILSGWNGNGTEEYPFIISNYNIDVFNDSIIIFSTTDYIIIENNSINSNGIGIGIYLELTSNIKVRNNSILGSTFGIMVSSSTNITINGNSVIENSEGGIRFLDSNFCYIMNNYLDTNTHSSIDLLTSHDMVVSSNTILNTIYMFTQSGDYGAGVYIRDSSINQVKNNIISNRVVDGVLINENSTYNLVESNIFYKVGIDLVFKTSHNTIRDNTIINPRLGIYTGNYNGGGHVIENNSIFFAWFYGIGAGQRDNVIRYNDIYGSANGLLAEDGYYNEFYGNSLENITNFSIDVKDLNRISNDNRFYLNSFLDPDAKVSIDNSATHLDNGIYGNYWDSYEGNDSNMDGIGDSSFKITNIDGTSSFVSDVKPLMSVTKEVNMSKYYSAKEIIESLINKSITIESTTPLPQYSTFPYFTSTQPYYYTSSDEAYYYSSSSNSSGIVFIFIILLVLVGFIGFGLFMNKNPKPPSYDYSTNKYFQKPKSVPKINFCTSCGHQVVFGDNFCENCGYRL